MHESLFTYEFNGDDSRGKILVEQTILLPVRFTKKKRNRSEKNGKSING